MKVHGSYVPERYEIDQQKHFKKTEIHFFENIQEDPENEGNYTFDRYTIEQPYDENIEERLLADYDTWFDFAKTQDYNKYNKAARAKREELLQASDWTQVLDAPISAESREAYRVYRQELRDITEQSEYPYITTWPEPPEKEKAAPDPVDEAFDLLVGGEADA